MKFLLDESAHRGLLSFLNNIGHDASLSPKTVKNGKVFELAVNEERLLITRDSDFLDKDKFPPSGHFGVILLRVRARDIESQKLGMSNLLKEHADLKGKVVILLSVSKFEFV